MQEHLEAGTTFESFFGASGPVHPRRRPRIRMAGALTTENGRRRLPFDGEVLMPCTLRVTAAGTTFVAAGTPVDEHRVQAASATTRSRGWDLDGIASWGRMPETATVC